MRPEQRYGSVYDPKVATERAKVRQWFPGGTDNKTRLAMVLHRVAGNRPNSFAIDRLRVKPLQNRAVKRWEATIYEYTFETVQSPMVGNAGLISTYYQPVVVRHVTITATGRTLPIEEFTTKMMLLFGA